MLQKLTHRLAALSVGAGPWAVALSGGPDSLALAASLVQLNPQTTAFIVDHGLRAESAAEAQTVAARARALGLTAQVLNWQGHKPATGIMAAARAARYQLLVCACEQAGIGQLFLGHQYDDQLETVAMRQSRGSGWRGLAGMPWQSRLGEVTLLRPWLDVPKAELVAYCEQQKLAYVRDPSNQNPRFARSQLRGQDLSAHAATQRTCAQRRQAEVTQMLALEGQGYNIHPVGYATVTTEALAQSGLLAAVLGLIGQQAYAPDSARLEAAITKLQQGTSLTLGGCRLLVQGRQLLVAREAGAINGQFIAARWDGRWKISPPVPHEVKALGKNPWRKGAQAAWLASLPGAVRAGLPANGQNDVLPGLWQPYQQPLRQIFAINSAADSLSAIG